MNKDDKSALMEIFQVFGTLSHVDYQSVFRKGAFYRWSVEGFHSL